MAYKITFDPTDEDSSQPRIGGKSFLPANLDWPINPDGTALTLAISLPCKLLNTELQLNLPDLFFVSVFTTYSKTDYFLDTITYSGSEEELENIRSGYTKVIIHEKGPSRNASEYSIPAMRLVLNVMENDTENYTGSKFSGRPGFLQKKIDIPKNHEYVLQLYSSDFPQDFQDIFYLTDSVGYLLINTSSSSDAEAGLFFTQAT